MEKPNSDMQFFTLFGVYLNSFASSPRQINNTNCPPMCAANDGQLGAFREICGRNKNKPQTTHSPRDEGWHPDIIISLREVLFVPEDKVWTSPAAK